MAVPPPPSLPPTGHLAPDPAKPALRAELRARRKAYVAGLGPGGVQAGAEAAARILAEHIPVGAVVAVYLALRDEIDPAPLIDLLVARRQPLCLPWLGDETSMGFRAWSIGDGLTRGPFNLRQPLPDAPLVTPDLIVTPLVGFDRAGGRIGQGASHYDRAFARFPGAHRIGYAWSVQETRRVPHDPWDIALHAVATELEWITAA